MSKQRIESIYFLRLIAMLFVVLVHVCGAFSYTLPVASDAYQKYYFINRIVRIEAGIFIMLTGMVFFYNYYKRKFTFDVIKDYFKKRVTFILVPYIVWALIYEFYSFRIGIREPSFRGVIERILHGESYYQLHFIFLIVQFYLVLPLIVFGAQKLPVFKKYMWLFGIVLELGYYFLNSYFGFTGYVLFINHIGSFLLGGWLGIHYMEQKRKIYNRSNYLWGLVAIGTGVFAVILHYFTNVVGEHLLPPHSYKVIWLMYLLAGGYLLFRLTEIISEKFPRSIVHVVKNIAMYSFGFYLLHPLVLREVAKFIPVHNSYLFHLDILLRYIVVVVVCYLIIWATHRFIPFAGIFFGKLPKRAVFLYDRKQIQDTNQKKAL